MTITRLDDAIQLHALALQAEGRSIHTQKQYLAYEQRFLNWLEQHGKPLTIESLAPVNVSEFLAAYRSEKHPRRRRGGEVAVRAASDILKRLGQVLEDQGVIDENPLRRMRRPRIAQILRQPFTQVELVALHAAARRSQQPLRDTALFLLLLDTGMRIGEACGLRLDDVDLVRGQIRIGTQSKGRRERLVPLSGVRDRARKALAAYLERRPEAPWADGRVFIGRDGHPLTPEGGHDVIARLGKVAGVDNCFPHRLRHHFATEYLKVHVGDELGLREILGHVSQRVLSSYIHFAGQTIRQRAARVTPSDSLPTPAPVKQPITTLERRFGTHADQQAMVAAVRTDPELRRVLLEAILGSA